MVRPASDTVVDFLPEANITYSLYLVINCEKLLLYGNKFYHHLAYCGVDLQKRCSLVNCEGYIMESALYMAGMV